MHPATMAVGLGRPPRSADAPLNEPVVFASALAAGGDVGYTRTEQANVVALEDVLGALEGGHAVVFGSGMAAITAVLDVLAPRSIARPPVIYAGARAALADRGIRIAEITDWSEPTGTDLTWLESPTNPDLTVIDIAQAAANSTTTVVDNTFATPLGQHPLSLGAAVSIHSVSKFIAGHSDVILGVAIAAEPELAAELRKRRELTGGIAGPMEAWLALRGLRTLPVRLQRASENASVIAQRLHDEGFDVRWPGLAADPGYETARRQMMMMPAVVALVMPDAESAERLCARTRIWTHATSLGGVESTLERRRKWSGESPQVPAGLVRLSVGLEHVEDLWDDLRQALG